jgi:hypothetical protein
MRLSEKRQALAAWGTGGGIIPTRSRLSPGLIAWGRANTAEVTILSSEIADNASPTARLIAAQCGRVGQ